MSCANYLTLDFSPPQFLFFMLTNQLEFSPSCLILLPSPLFQVRTWLHFLHESVCLFSFVSPVVDSMGDRCIRSAALLLVEPILLLCSQADFRRNYFTVERVSPLDLDGIFIWFSLMDFNWFSLAWPVTTPIYLALPEDLHTWGTISIFTHQLANIL